MPTHTNKMFTVSCASNLYNTGNRWGRTRSLERPFTDPETPSRMTRICPAASKARLSSYARPPKGNSWPVLRQRHPYDYYMCFISSLLPTQLLNCQWRKRRWHSLLKYKMPKNPSQKSRPTSRLQPGQNEKRALYILYLTPERPLTSWSKAAQRPVCICPPSQWARKM